MGQNYHQCLLLSLSIAHTLLLKKKQKSCARRNFFFWLSHLPHAHAHLACLRDILTHLHNAGREDAAVNISWPLVCRAEVCYAVPQSRLLRLGCCMLVCRVQRGGGQWRCTTSQKRRAVKSPESCARTSVERVKLPS
jgi:hypothetical protein